MSRAAGLVTLVGLAALGAGCQGGFSVEGAIGSVFSVMTEGAGTARAAFTDMDEPQEIELGRAVTAAIGGRYPLLRDRELTRYVALVGNAVAAQSERPDVRYYFAVLDTAEVNAFAAPGGFVFITRGALALMRDEATLAGVLGHEAAHVALRHGVEAVKAQKRKELALLGLREGLSFTQAAPFTEAIGSAADALVEQVVLKGFSRTEESAADRAGLEYARRAGYDAAGLRDFLAALQARSGRDAGLARFFSTHPGTDERLREQDEMLRGQPVGRRNAERFVRAVATR